MKSCRERIKRSQVWRNPRNNQDLLDSHLGSGVYQENSSSPEISRKCSQRDRWVPKPLRGLLGIPCAMSKKRALKISLRNTQALLSSSSSSFYYYYVCEKIYTTVVFYCDVCKFTTEYWINKYNWKTTGRQVKKKTIANDIPLQYAHWTRMRRLKSSSKYMCAQKMYGNNLPPVNGLTLSQNGWQA